MELENSYAQEIRYLMEQKRLQPTVLSRHCIPSFIRKVFSDWEEDYNKPRFLIKECIRLFYLQIITSQN